MKDITLLSDLSVWVNGGYFVFCNGDFQLHSTRR